MPTFNQLVRKGRQVLATKSTAPALLKSYNSQKKQYSDLNSPQKRGVCTAVRIIRGTLDTQGVAGRNQARSKYGAKRPKAGAAKK